MQAPYPQSLLRHNPPAADATRAGGRGGAHAASQGLRRPIGGKRLLGKAAARPEGKKSCGDKALIRIASP
jgi:hypothetical protein